MEMRKNKFHAYARDEEFEKFNSELKTLTEPVDLESCDLSNLDLRKFNLKTANLKNSYLKMADLRGADLSEAYLEGASINRAHISGAYFPKNVSAEEIQLSVEHGTRIRYTR
ncbi:MAG: pentapeptide repeat-containing protein [Pseudomonadota bacterium]